ncbi:ecotropic viral integration site 5 protein isoform X1 [Clarias magur]|uniref:Ecotropic viral integration site 5 protein isoform X1 n=1 Tax=Clarias magur TaxID=1594786 RepID=A0A8J4WWH2_CLAMG|nr:ecotropic viral integration site 5 protein isoform X1 [Clarias magur]
MVATDKVAGKLSSTLSWVKNSVSHTVSQMASQVAAPSSLHTTVGSSTVSLSPPGLSPSTPSSTQLSPDEVELLAKLEEQNRRTEGLCICTYQRADVRVRECRWLCKASGTEKDLGGGLLLSRR